MHPLTRSASAQQLGQIYEIDQWPVSFEQLREYRLSRGLPWFTDQWSINLFVVRSGRLSVWEDEVIACVYDTCYRQVTVRCRASASAWFGEWTNPTHPDGTVYVLDGHYPSMYQLGLHNGREALQQVNSCHNTRWPPSKGYAPTTCLELEAYAAEGHMFVADRDCNLHDRVDYHAPGRPLTDDTEGCVNVLYQHEHAGLIRLVKTQKLALGSDVCSATFLQRSAFFE